MLGWLCTELCAIIVQFTDYQTRLCLTEVNRFWRELAGRELALTMTKGNLKMNRYQTFFLDNLANREKDVTPIICIGHGNMGKRTAIVQSMFDSCTPNIVVWTHRPADPLWTSFKVAPTVQGTSRRGDEDYTIEGPSLIVVDIKQFTSSISVNPDGAIAHLIDADPRHVEHLDIVLPALVNLHAPIRICANRSDWILDRYRDLGNFHTLMPMYVGEIVHNTTGPKVPLSYTFLWDKFCRAMKIVTNVKEQDPNRSFTLLCSSKTDAGSMAKWIRECAPDLTKANPDTRRSVTLRSQYNGSPFVISTIRAAIAKSLIETSDIVYVDSPKTSTMAKLESKLNFANHRIVHFWYIGPDSQTMSSKKAWKSISKKGAPRKQLRQQVVF